MPQCLWNAWALVLFSGPCDPARASQLLTPSYDVNQPLLLQQQLNDSSVIISALKTYLVSG